jgi:hypothetical protein
MGIVTARLQRAAARGRKVATLFCGNWGLTRRGGRILLPAAEGGCLHLSLNGFHGDVDVFENAARRDGDNAVGFDEVVPGVSALLATESVNETEGRAESASADGEAGAIGLPVVVLFVVAGGVRNFLIVLEHSRFTGRARGALICFGACVGEGTQRARRGQFHKIGAVVGKVACWGDGDLAVSEVTKSEGNVAVAAGLEVVGVRV